MNNPKLIEPGVKYFFDKSLKNCNIVKKEYNSNIINIGLLILFIIFFGGFLYYKNNKKELEKEKKLINEERAKKEIIERCNKINEEKYKEQGHIITNIPKFEENEFEKNMNNLNENINTTTSINNIPNLIMPTQLEAINFNNNFSNLNL
jgi:uncharacterized protein YneF (UPF0154 family)